MNPTPEAAESDKSSRDGWKAFSHPLRVAILGALEDGSAERVTDIAREVSAAPNSVSFHLRVLAKYGLIEIVPATEGEVADKRTTRWRIAKQGAIVVPDLSREGGSEHALAISAVQELEQRALMKTRIWFAEAIDPEGAPESFNFDQTLSLSETELTKFKADLAELFAQYAAETDDTSQHRRIQVWGFGLVAPDAANSQ